MGKADMYDCYIDRVRGTFAGARMLSKGKALCHCLLATCCLTACSTAPRQDTLEQFEQAEPVAQAPAQSELPDAPVGEQLLPEPILPNEFILRSDDQRVVGQPQRVVTRWEDTFAGIARAYGLGYDELVAANPGIDPWLPGEGTVVLLPTQYILPDGPREGLVLNVATRRLFYYPPRTVDAPARVFTYPIGVGRVGWNTPLGRYSIISKVTDPTWTPPASIRREHAAEGRPLPAVVSAGPHNPLGRHALRLSLPSYLIHGTNKPAGVGMRVSHGCVRLFPENIEELYGMIALGAAVTIVNQPYLLAWYNGELYLEAHAPLADDNMHPAQRLQELLARAQAESGYFPSMSAEVQLLQIVNAASGVPVRLLRENNQQVVLRARRVRNVLVVEQSEENAAIWN